MKNRIIAGLSAVALSLAMVATSTVIRTGYHPAYAAQVPARCMYIFAAASYRYADMVSAQVRQLDAPEELRLAAMATRLSNDLQCPTALMTATVDCALERIMSSKGAKPEFIDILQCVEKATGQDFPQIPG